MYSYMYSEQNSRHHNARKLNKNLEKVHEVAKIARALDISHDSALALFCVSPAPKYEQLPKFRGYYDFVLLGNLAELSSHWSEGNNLQQS